MSTSLWPGVSEDGALVPARTFERAKSNAAIDLHAAWREAQGHAPDPYFNGTLRQFCAEVHPRFKFYRHIEILAERLEAVVSGELKRLMTFEPPRHGKSLLKSRIFPAYTLAKRPDWWFGLCSYEATLAQDFSRTARDNYQRVGGRLRDDSAAVSLWQTVNGGGMWAAGVGGPITGKGFNVGAIDDPIKNQEEADSANHRVKQPRWYESTFTTRAEPDAAILLTMTRWHEADLAGWLLARELEEPENWEIVDLPAILDLQGVAYPVTCTVAPDWRKPVDKWNEDPARKGQALCPERYPADVLRSKMRKAGSRVAEALYQQRPAPDSGTIFKREWWRFWSHPDRPIRGTFLRPPRYDVELLSADCSFKDLDTSDYVSIGAWGVSGARIFLDDRVNEHMSFTATCSALRTMSGKHPLAIGKYVEEAANGAAIINAMQRDVMGIVAVKPDGGKVARAYAVQSLVEGGYVYLPHPSIAPWVEDFIRQLASFPAAAHDDDVDMTTQALNQLAWIAREEPPPPPDASKDQHPGFDLKRKRRKARRRVTVTDEGITMVDPDFADDDIRPQSYHMPRMAPPRMPSFFDGGGSDDE